MCGRDVDCTCRDDELDRARWDAEDRASAAREEAAYVAACRAHGLEPYSSRDLPPDEARDRLEELETARRDMARDGGDQ